MRYFRLLLGSAIIVLVLWVIVGEQMSGASANAFVNARLVTVRAPVAGQLTIPDRALGHLVRAGEEIGAVSDPLVDTIRLNDLIMERAFAAAELASVTARLDAANGQIAPLTARLSVFAEARIAELAARLAHARERLEVVEGDGQSGMPLSDLAAGTEGGEGARDPRLAAMTLADARERVAVLEIALAAARDGVFVGDSYNDAPYSEQRQTEIVLLRAGLAADRDLAVARLAALETRITQEHVRTSALAGAALKSPANGLLWEMLASNGETVQRGQDVMRVVDCDSVVVTVSVTESVFNRLKTGDSAIFRMTGEGRTLPATILRLAGSGARTVYQNLAVAPTQKHLERFDVMLVVPGLRNDADPSCFVGRTGRVFFDRRPLDALRGLWQ